MYKCVIDSDWIDISQLSVFVGKNESGKTSLLKALHKLNPYKPEPYSIDREWPRGYRKERNPNQVVCRARFELNANEAGDLAALTDRSMPLRTIEITRDYAGNLEVLFPEEIFPDRLHPNDIDEICASLPQPSEPVSDEFRKRASNCIDEARRLAYEGRYSSLIDLKSTHTQILQQSYTPGNPHPQHQNESQFVAQYTAKLDEISRRLQQAPSIQKKAHEYAVQHLPTFIYMSDYRTFMGTAQLDQVKQRKDRGGLTEEDKTLITIMELSGLDLEEEVRKGSAQDREQRQYDLDDASATLTNTIDERWRQRKYEVQFRADGQLFYTFVKDQNDPSLIRLEERSKGFQWFFSFDLMFMYESKGTFQNCVILLDEPGLHLHPDAQKDLLVRMENYAKDNVLIYSTHLPFMIDLRNPERIRVLSETDRGTVVSGDLMKSQPEAKLVLQAALGMSGSTSYLVSQRNLVVEGVDDYWIITELSNLLERSSEQGLPEDLYITPSGGASEVAYIATFMIGQKLDVVALLDSDSAGDDAADKLIKNWLTRYHSTTARVLRLGEIAGIGSQDFSIEDIFTDDFYLERVKKTYSQQLSVVGVTNIKLKGKDQLRKKVERFFEQHGLVFNRGSVAKLIRRDLIQMQRIDQLPPETAERGRKVIKAIIEALSKEV